MQSALKIVKKNVVVGKKIIYFLNSPLFSSQWSRNPELEKNRLNLNFSLRNSCFKEKKSQNVKILTSQYCTFFQNFRALYDAKSALQATHSFWEIVGKNDYDPQISYVGGEGSEGVEKPGSREEEKFCLTWK